MTVRVRFPLVHRVFSLGGYSTFLFLACQLSMSRFEYANRIGFEAERKLPLYSLISLGHLAT